MVTINSTLISGAGAIPAIAPLLTGKKKLLLVSDGNVIKLAATQQILTLLQAEDRQVQVIDSVPPEPSQHDVARILGDSPDAAFDLVVGIGGGSVLDVSKLLSVLCHPRSPGLDALLAGEKPTARVPSLLIPATAGTGSEATPNAILAIPEQNTKVGLSSPCLRRDYASCLRDLTTRMQPLFPSPPAMEPRCILMECFPATTATRVGVNVALTGLRKLLRNIETAISEPHNLTARLEMLWASYYGGAAITHAGTHLVHALSYPLGGKYHLPHGVANAILLAPCMKVVRPYVVEKFAQVWDLVPDADTTLSDEDKSHALVDYFAALVKRLNLPDNLEALGVPRADIPSLADAALNVKRLMNNAPCTVDHSAVQAIYQTLFQIN